MPRPRIDLNCDAGEHYGRWTLGDDAAMFRAVTSANIATGFHAGDPASILETCRLAVEAGLSFGAHVGYHDLSGFGRRFLDIDPRDLRAETLYQLGALSAVARNSGGRVSYVKPHGALYHAVATNEPQARAVVEGMLAFDDSLPLLVEPGSIAGEIARDRGLRVVREVFADRGYNADGTLVARGQPGDIVSTVDEVVDRVVRFATEGVFAAVDGSTVAIEADSVCLHGDTPGAPELARAVRDALGIAGVDVEPFTNAHR